jgi:hypothetical protein
MTRIAMFALIALTLAACSRKREEMAKYDMALSTEMIQAPSPAQPALQARVMPNDVAQAPAAEPSAKPPADIHAIAQQVAYTYGFGIQAPAAKIPDLVSAHEKACTAAGPTRCLVVHQSLNRGDADSAEAELTLRAAPAWFTRFKADLPGQARAAGGRVTSSNVESEDLTREIVDTDAALRAKTTLRDRLQTLLATHPGRVSDLLEVERELARVQGEIDAAQSELNMMRGRVAMSQVNLTYASRGELAPQSAWSPLRSAIEGFLGMVSSSLALIVVVLGALLPWLAISAIALWLGRKRLARLWGRRKAQP